MQKVRRQLVGVVFFFHSVVPGDHIQVVTFGSKQLSPMSHQQHLFPLNW